MHRVFMALSPVGELEKLIGGLHGSGLHGSDLRGIHCMEFVTYELSRLNNENVSSS